MKEFLLNHCFFIFAWLRAFKARKQIREEGEEAFSALVTAAPGVPKAYLCCVPMHTNMGDQAQRYCIEMWIRENYPQHQTLSFPTWAFYNSTFKRALEEKIGEDDIIVVQSGYCTTDRHKDHAVHRYLAKTFKDTPILIMPQTVNFHNPKEGYKTGEIYGSHKKLLFLARDQKSYETALKYFPETPVLLYPDIVTTLIGTGKEHKTEGRSVLMCLRNDSERKLSKAEEENMKTALEEQGIRVDVSDTNSDFPAKVLIRNFKEELGKTLDFFSSHGAVITDRYHGTIFSMAANTPVIVLETNDHKVKTGTEWFKGIYDGAFYNAKSADEAVQMAELILEEGESVNNGPYFKEAYYDVLKEKFSEACGNAD